MPSPMNAAQKKYAIERIEVIVRRKREDIEGRYPIEKPLGDRERLELIRAGQAKLDPSRCVMERYGPPSIFTVFGLDDDSDLVERNKIAAAARAAEMRKVEAEAAALRDAIMLGRLADNGLSALRKFEEGDAPTKPAGRKKATKG